MECSAKRLAGRGSLQSLVRYSYACLSGHCSLLDHFLIRSVMQNRVFSGLNYSLGNEDCRVETRLLAPNTGHVVCVAIGGSQLVPFLSRRPKAVTFVDISKDQLLFAELRLKLLQMLSFDEFVQF